MKETLAEIMPRVINSLLKNIHTAIPGRIESYDKDTFRATVLPLVSHVTMNNKEIELKPIDDVPVIMYGSINGLVDIEFAEGDNVLLIFTESEIGGWKSSDGEKQVAPEDLAHHVMTNAIAIPCIIPDGKVSDYADVPKISINSKGEIILKNKNIGLTMDPSGNLQIKNTNGSIAMDSGGRIMLNEHFTVIP